MTPGLPRRGAHRRLLALAVVLLAGLAGCVGAEVGAVVVTPNEVSTHAATFTLPGGPPLAPAPVPDMAAREPPLAPALADDLALARDHFRNGRYGLAEMHFRRAVEANPRDVAAWLGLAASDDELRRFGLADRAYARAERLGGVTTTLLNNRGYSYLLRGDLGRASRDLSAAAAREPDNERVRENLETLEARSRGRS